MIVPSFDFDYLRQLVRQQSGVVLEPHKDYLAALHLGQIAADAGFPSIAAFVEHLKGTALSELHLHAVDALVIKETSFFRDRSPFETLKSSVIPALLQSRSNERAINIWCAGCSTGQEPYSIAILIREAFPELLTWTIRLIATDFSKQVLDRAQRGQYTDLEMSRGLPCELRDRYFHRVGQAWQINDEIRQMVQFRRLNLIRSWDSLPNMDVIFLRNVLIYFDIDTKRSILNQVKSYLQADGYLFLGSGETTFHLDPKFEAIQSKTSFYHRLRSA